MEMQDMGALERAMDRLAEENEVLATGVRALLELDKHANEASGFPALDPRVCAPCMRYTAALLRGAQPKEVQDLRCEQSRVWFGQARAAAELAGWI